MLCFKAQTDALPKRVYAAIRDIQRISITNSRYLIIDTPVFLSIL